jgi:hypothetical protein
LFATFYYEKLILLQSSQNNIWSDSFFDFPAYSLEHPVEDARLELPESPRPTVIVWERPGHSPDELASFLQKILSALPIQNRQEIFSVSLTAGQKLGLLVLLRRLEAQRVIVFGLSPMRLGLAIQPEEYTLFRLGMRQYLWAHDLKAIQAERQAGGKKMSGPLWKALQMMFNET